MFMYVNSRVARSRVAVYAGQLALVGLVLVPWEASVRLGWLNPAKSGQPSQIWFYLQDALHRGYIWPHLGVTLYEQASGFALGTGIGTVLGLGLWWSRTLARILEPFVVVFNSIPKIALAPPMIVWFGIYETSKIVLAASICLAWLNAYSGVRTVDRDLVDMVRAVGGSRWQAFTKVVVPSTLPWMLSAVKINVGFALTGAVVGEFVASQHGLGFLAAQAGMLFQMSRLWMLVLVIIAVAAVQYYGALALERHLLRGFMQDRP
jgi:NitT/TauT family transport system permease protein